MFTRMKTDFLIPFVDKNVDLMSLLDATGTPLLSI